MNIYKDKTYKFKKTGGGSHTFPDKTTIKGFSTFVRKGEDILKSGFPELFEMIEEIPVKQVDLKVVGSTEEPKEESKEEPKEESKEEPKEEPKDKKPLFVPKVQPRRKRKASKK